MRSQSTNNLSETDLATRIRRLEQQLLNGNTPEEITLSEQVTGEVSTTDDTIDELEELSVTDRFTAPRYADAESIPDFPEGSLSYDREEGSLYLEVGE